LFRGPAGPCEPEPACASLRYRGMALKDKVKTALDETRLLILGGQILFGFQLNGMFQDAFAQVSQAGRGLNACGYFLMATSVGLLIAPSMQHRLVERGQDTVRLLRAATMFAAVALIAFAPSLGISFYIVLERHVGAAIAAAAGAAFAVLALFFWFAIARIIKPPEKNMPDDQDEEKTPLPTRIDQMLTESRMLLPGAQAILGFQFAIMLSKSFDELPPSAHAVHVAALGLIAFAVILLMTPAAIHRITFGGEASERFHTIGSRFIVAAAVPLGLGISFELYVALVRVTQSPALGIAGACVIAALFAGLWFVQPLILRARRPIGDVATRPNSRR
jgi:hypothetical protein